MYFVAGGVRDNCNTSFLAGTSWICHLRAENKELFPEGKGQSELQPFGTLTIYLCLDSVVEYLNH